MPETEKATFAAGCFWGVETDFRKIEGVLDVAVGYIGGELENPDYKSVCSGRTGHAEAVELEFDPEKVTYEHLLAMFFTMHDPTQKDRQGPDIGSQYRSAVFYHSDEQKKAAEAKVFQLAKDRSIATQIVPAVQFWRAEEYHQQYHAKNGGSCGL